MRLIHIKPYKRHASSYQSAYARARDFCVKHNMHFVDIRCNECEVDDLKLIFSKLNCYSLSPLIKDFVVFLSEYHVCSNDMKNFINTCLNSCSFPINTFIIVSVK